MLKLTIAAQVYQKCESCLYICRDNKNALTKYIDLQQHQMSPCYNKLFPPVSVELPQDHKCLSLKSEIRFCIHPPPYLPNLNVHISNKEYLGLTSDEDRTVMLILSRPSHLLRKTTKPVL